MDTFHITFDRILSSADAKKNIPFTFQVPDGTTQLHITLSFAPWQVDNIYNMLTLSVFDPTGFRGAGHRHGDKHAVVLHAQTASPGYYAKPIQPGEWTVYVDTHMIMPGPLCSIHLDITGTDETIPADAPTNASKPRAARGAGWYRGDLHAHTIHSDAQWELDGLLAWAQENHLDFCTLSDHNTVTGLLPPDSVPRDGVLLLGGMELTTFWGHALALGLREWVDWRANNGRTMEQIAAEVNARGGLFIIAHPKAVGDPYCTGCRWVYDAMMPGNARAVEVWNDPWANPGDNNEDALALAFEWLNRGYRLALTSGTDIHGRARGAAPYGFDVVYAQDLSEREILRAVRAGHLYLSSGPRLELNASLNEQRAMMGDALNAANGAPIQVSAQWDACPPDAQLQWIVDGAVRETRRVNENGAHAWQLVGGQDHWCLVALRAANDAVLALTNPIYFDGRTF
jgi:hypothetical protein